MTDTRDDSTAIRQDESNAPAISIARRMGLREVLRLPTGEALRRLAAACRFLLEETRRDVELALESLDAVEALARGEVSPDDAARRAHKARVTGRVYFTPAAIAAVELESIAAEAVERTTWREDILAHLADSIARMDLDLDFAPDAAVVLQLFALVMGASAPTSDRAEAAE